LTVKFALPVGGQVGVESPAKTPGTDLIDVDVPVNTIVARPEKIAKSIPEEMVAETEQLAELDSEDSANE
jgi:hypothetical protein